MHALISDGQIHLSKDFRACIWSTNVEIQQIQTQSTHKEPRIASSPKSDPHWKTEQAKSRGWSQYMRTWASKPIAFCLECVERQVRQNSFSGWILCAFCGACSRSQGSRNRITLGRAWASSSLETGRNFRGSPRKLQPACETNRAPHQRNSTCLKVSRVISIPVLWKGRKQSPLGP